MQTIHDVDVLLMLATMMASKRRPAAPIEIMAALDFVQNNIPAAPKLVEAFSRMGASGLMVEIDGGYALTPGAQAIVADLPKKADSDERLFIIKDALSLWNEKGDYARIQISEETITAAITAHRAAAKTTAKNLLMPKPKDVEGEKKRPGLRARRPLPARKRKV